ncbi:MAG TPA: BTAD domain-containing putative transcriptional regulator [Longimicrobiales bacterium]
MLRLVTLGRIDLTDAHGRPVEAILKRPKRLALLAYLAVGGPGTLRSRDTVVGLFWPDETQARARQSLNQSLYVLRQELGKDVVLSVGNDQIGLAPGGIWCDAAALRAAEASGDHRSAQAHYRGDFLPGFYLGDAPDFEKWLENERAALRRLASSSAWKLAEECARAGDVEGAAASAVRSAELSLREEAAVRRAIELLDGLGERARALDLYRELEADLAEDFGTRPAPETQEVVARVRQREASPDVARALEPDPAVAVVTPRPRVPALRAPADAPDAAGAPRRRTLGLAAAAFAAIVVLAAVIWMLSRPADDVATLDLTEPHVLIEPFDAFAGDDRLTDIAGAITEGLAAQLAEVDALEVMLVEEGAPPPADSAALAQEAALTEARASFVVRGRVLREGDRMRALVSLIDGPSGQVIASATIERVTSDPIAFVDEATDDAARFTRAAVGRELRERAWRASTTDATAWRLLERAERDRREADELSSRGATLAADAALAQADSLLALASEREPRWLPPHVLRAHVAYSRMWTSLMPPTLDRDRAIDYLERGLSFADGALEIDTAEARAREMKGVLLYWGVMLDGVASDLSPDVLAQAESELRSAVAIDARRPDAWSALSSVLYHLGRYDEAYYAAQQAYAHDAYLDNPEDILVKLFNGAFEASDDDAARRWCNELQDQFAGSMTWRQCALTLLAWVEEPTRQSTDAAVRLAGEAQLPVGHPVSGLLDLHAAVVLARAGEADRALSMLQRVKTTGWNPEFSPLEASIHLALGDKASAAAVLTAYVEESPAIRRGILSSRRYDTLRE